MLEYGDSRDRCVSFVCYLWRKNELWYSYFNNEEQYTSDKSVARQYMGQKVWPRAVYVRRARFVFSLLSSSSIDWQTRYYNAARLRWNCIERKRGEIEDQLIDDLVEWSIWHYAVVRE